MNDRPRAKAIAVVGLGNMGSALAVALLSHGSSVVVWNRTISKATPLVQSGASLADSVAEAGKMADVMIVCVAEHSVIESVVHNDDVAKAMRGKCLLQLGTITADQARETAEWSEKHGIRYMEGSLLAVPDDIVAGSAILVCSGPRELYDEQKAILEMLGNPEHISNTIGAAYEFDKTIYPFGFGAMLGFIQGAAMAKASGYSVQAYTNILIERLKPIGNRLEKFGSLISKEDFTPYQATLVQWASGCKKSLELCQSLEVDDTFQSTNMAMLKKGIDQGHGEEEIIAVFKTLLPRS
jgi:3-hydroxyisobutyrate dehydrogenase-like beta-hydroxyacid dehydrogenase